VIGVPVLLGLPVLGERVDELLRAADLLLLALLLARAIEIVGGTNLVDDTPRGDPQRLAGGA